MFTIDFNGKPYIKADNAAPLFFIAGPCAMESRAHALEVSAALKEIFAEAGIPFLYKSSFDKANRSSGAGFRGVGMKEGLSILAEVRESRSVPVLTDIHTAEQAAPVAEVVDYLQTPAFLCRQTDLILAAAATMKPVNIKKGQFLAPWDCKNICEKMQAFGCDKYMLCERGTSFGYNNLIVDMRGMYWMKKFGCPVVFDATHSVQRPGGLGGATGGDRELAPVLANAAMTMGIDGVFMEVHKDPDHAMSDGPNQVRLSDLERVITNMQLIRNAYDQMS